jgi:DNA-binding MltR family transcriptional regulator
MGSNPTTDAASNPKDFSDAFDLFADDLLSERNVRPLIIIGASKVDHLLLEILRAFLLPKCSKPKEQDELLEGDTPLSTFSARIKMSRRLGLIDQTLYLALERLRPLRNLSAHTVSFDHTKSPARDHLSEFRLKISGRRSYKLTRDRYFDNLPLRPVEELQCLLLTLCVLLESIRERIRTTPGNKGALRIASK